jgi:RHS repeat-associated protein
VTFSDSDNDGHVTASDIKQINHYYPFGLNMEGNWNGAQGNNKYQYNEKEWNDDFGLGWNDYGARFYDPAMSRWVAVDPLAEKYLEMRNK